MQQHLTTNPQATKQLGKQLAKQIKASRVLALSGELGAGKTQWVKGLASGLGIKEVINSPTFVILKKYALPKKHGSIKYLIHLDCYRLNSSEELLELGWEELINSPTNLIVVEWAEKIKDILPAQTQWIKFKNLGGNKRQITIN